MCSDQGQRDLSIDLAGSAASRQFEIVRVDLTQVIVYLFDKVCRQFDFGTSEPPQFRLKTGSPK